MVLRRRFGWRYIIMLVCVLMAAGAAFLGQQPKPLQATMVADSENGTKVLVLNYHKIDHTFISLAVRPEDFDHQMKYLRDNGYHTISPDELYEALAGSGNLPENPVMITFDDGYEDNYTNAYPILKKYGFKATIFVVTGFLDKHKKGYLSWDEAREMNKNGINIESHTVNHRSMTDLTDDELLRKCIISLSDTILYTDMLIDRQYKLEVKRDEMRRICYVYKKLWNTLNTTEKHHIC